MPRQHAPRTAARRARFREADHGAITSLGLFLALAVFMLGGLALDVANVYSQRTQIQAAADTAAHAALVARHGVRPGEFSSESEARNTALEITASNLPTARHGTSLTAEDVEFGRWSPDGSIPWSERFTPEPGARQAVRVHTRRIAQRANSVPAYLFGLIGLDRWNVNTASVFEVYQPACLREGFVGESRVDVESNNEYLRGFCVHSNAYVSINQNNYFEDGTIVSMPDLDRLEIPNSGFDKNEGLEAALREDTMDIRILRETGTITEALEAGDADYLPDYIDSRTPVALTLDANNNVLTADDLAPGYIYDIACSRSGGRISVPGGEIVEGVVIVTDCNLDLGSNARFEDVVFSTRSTDANSISGASRVTFGRNDACAPGGGAQIITQGGMSFPASLGLFGAQLIAQGDVSFAARADGIQGASIVAGGEINGTSNSTMARCGTGMEGNFTVPYFRMAM
ncbi:hypothetical protein C2I36_04940 [Rhodobacteraceae bacterium WD3A24]|nr:hypothetical protein C2I36_04940 [Rhodobacteraceae bacterium WD3A24]